MSFFKSIKSAFGGSEDEYDVFGQTTSFVNPFSKDKNVTDREHVQEDVQIQVDEHEEYAIDAEFADKAVKLMNDHTLAVIDMLKGSWKKEREELIKKVEQAEAVVEESKEKMQVNEANRRQAQNRASDLTNKVAELEGQLEKLDIEKKSLESRIKAMEVKGNDNDELNAKMEEMNATIEDLRKQVADRDAEIERRDNMPLPADDGPTIDQLNQKIEQRDELIERLRENITELEGRLNAAAEELKGAEELKKAVEQVEEFKDKKNSEISSLRQQIIDLRERSSQFDELRKANIVLNEEKETLQKNIEQLEQAAKQNADVQNRRSIETGNLIDGLKQQLATVSAMAEDYKRKYNSLSMDGNEKAASFARITAERDDAKAELKRTQVTLQKKQHEAQAMSDAINEKDRRIASLAQQVEELEKRLQAAPAAQVPTIQDDPAMSAIDDIDWDDDGSMPPHPGEDPRQLSLF
jgi:chromosome segregation ATPase